MFVRGCDNSFCGTHPNSLHWHTTCRWNGQRPTKRMWLKWRYAWSTVSLSKFFLLPDDMLWNYPRTNFQTFHAQSLNDGSKNFPIKIEKMYLFVYKHNKFESIKPILSKDFTNFRNQFIAFPNSNPANACNSNVTSTSKFEALADAMGTEWRIIEIMSCIMAVSKEGQSHQTWKNKTGRASFLNVPYIRSHLKIRSF